MKGYTDIEQSRKLATILPLESADMIYIMYHNGEKPQNDDVNLSTVYESNDHKWYWVDIIDGSWDMRIGEDIPCWSLAALLKIIGHYTLQTNTDGTVFVVCESKKPMISDTYDNPVDACVAMIEELHELNLL